MVYLIKWKGSNKLDRVSVIEVNGDSLMARAAFIAMEKDPEPEIRQVKEMKPVQTINPNSMSIRATLEDLNKDFLLESGKPITGEEWIEDGLSFVLVRQLLDGRWSFSVYGEDPRAEWLRLAAL